MMLRLSDELLDRWLAEDVPHGDLTTQGLAIGAQPGRMQFAARTAQVVCCVEEAVRLIERAGAPILLPTDRRRLCSRRGKWRRPWLRSRRASPPRRLSWSSPYWAKPPEVQVTIEAA